MPTIPEIPVEFTIDDLAVLIAIAFAAGIAYLIARRLLSALEAKIVSRMNPKLAAPLQRQRVSAVIALLAPVLVIALTRSLLSAHMAWAQEFLRQSVNCYIIVVLGVTLYRLLYAFEEMLVQDRDAESRKSIHGIFHWLRIATIAISSILALGAFANIQITWILTWIGVIAAAGSIVFSDMIYNAVSHAIIRARKLVSVGDWIEVPALQINGAVKEIGPLVILVQNWDNSLATVAPRYLLNETFRNWQQMYHVGQRRILRYFYVDVMTVRPLDDELLAARSLPGVGSYLDQRALDFGSMQAATETLTNVALYRIYLMSYLGAHPKVAKDNIWRVTNEDSLGQGLPLLMLAYLTETQDIPYRLLDAEIYEHALATAPLFGIVLFQRNITVSTMGDTQGNAQPGATPNARHMTQESR